MQTDKKRRVGMASERRERQRQAAISHPVPGGHGADPHVKRRGGQPRNQNARKHGFYSAHFRRRETELLENLEPSDISAEIELIRVTCSRFLRAWNESKGTPGYEASLTALRAVNLSAQTIAMLLRAQSITGVANRDVAELLEALNKNGAETESDSPSPFGFVPDQPARLEP